MKKVVTLTMTVMSVALMITACGTNGESNVSTGNAAGEQSGAGKQMLIFGRGADSTTLDPATTSDGESFLVTQEIYDTLLTYKPGSSELTGDLASSWEVSADGLTWTFHLLKGVKFQDGTEFNADAVVFNFKRWWDPQNPYHKGAFPHFKQDFGGYKGDPNCVFKGIEKVDDYTVKIHLTHPYAPLPHILTQQEYGIASPDDVKKYNGDISRHPVGTGAFEFVSWSPNDKIVLKKNPNYREPGYPKLDGIIFEVIPDNSARLNALRAGQIDLMEGLNPSDVQSVKSDSNLQLFTAPSVNVGYLAFNTQKPPFNNEKVRQAINLVIDRKGIVDAYFNGLGVPASSLLPPLSWAYNSSLSVPQVDVAKAKQLLVEAGYPNGFRTDFWAMPVPRPYMPQPQQIATAIQADLSKIGIQTRIVTFDWATYLKKTQSGEAPMYLLGWGAGHWDPSSFEDTLLNSKNTVPPAGNLAFYKNPQVDKLLAQALNVADQQKRADLYRQVEAIAAQSVPYVPLVHAAPAFVGSKSVQGFVPVATEGAQFTHVSINR
ncbi:ABC transporter substrate-binding protein [Alicyclobacillus macrosporangiidus]|uniref:ABC transporter substrate-binding protein n=1 Tax=Alicyclobacillus macrosporangiidus TaxID=392015 RepID=UPI000494DAFE|nr:ABC transporter substrate-binding protein [Alicyclobacillus macrosporangiidus]